MKGYKHFYSLFFVFIGFDFQFILMDFFSVVCYGNERRTRNVDSCLVGRTRTVDDQLTLNFHYSSDLHTNANSFSTIVSCMPTLKCIASPIGGIVCAIPHPLRTAFLEIQHFCVNFDLFYYSSASKSQYGTYDRGN